MGPSHTRIYVNFLIQIVLSNVVLEMEECSQLGHIEYFTLECKCSCSLVPYFRMIVWGVDSPIQVPVSQ